MGSTEIQPVGARGLTCERVKQRKRKKGFHRNPTHRIPKIKAVFFSHPSLTTISGSIIFSTLLSDIGKKQFHQIHPTPILRNRRPHFYALYRFIKPSYSPKLFHQYRIVSGYIVVAHPCKQNKKVIFTRTRSKDQGYGPSNGSLIAYRDLSP